MIDLNQKNPDEENCFDLNGLGLVGCSLVISLESIEFNGIGFTKILESRDFLKNTQIVNNVIYLMYENQPILLLDLKQIDAITFLLNSY